METRDKQGADQTRSGARPATLAAYRPGARVTPEEIRQILLDDGYSAGERSGWLKTLLTDLTMEESNLPDHNKEALIDLVKEMIEQNQSGESIASDSL